jgi:hypothetical protein
VSPASGAEVDFSTSAQKGSEVVYTVKNGDLYQKYKVSVDTVHLGEPPVPVIMTIYNGEDVCPQWAGIAGVVESPFDNPKTNGINPSAFCASILRNGADTDDGGKAWSGGALWGSYKVNIDPAVYDRFSLMVLKEVAGDVQLEIQSDGEQNKDWLKVWYGDEHLGEWVELVFTIPAGRTAVINNILVAPHCHDAGQPVAFPTQRMYWDNLKALPK